MFAELDKAIRFREALSEGRVMFGAQISLTDPAVAEILGTSGFDWLVIDHEHTTLDDEDARRMHQAASQTPALVVARPPRVDPVLAMRLLDIGASGIITPFVSTVDDASTLVRATRYPPYGDRSWGPRRASGYGADAVRYFEQANAAILRFAIIETPHAVDVIDDILAVDGLDGVVIGPQDLALGLGVFGRFDSSEFRKAVDKVRSACATRRIPMGTGCYSTDHARECAAAGDQLLLVAGDDALLSQAGQALLNDLRPTAPESA